MAPTLANPGDLIEIFRLTYQHWALYIGGDEVVHLTTPGEGSNSSGYNLVVLVDCNKAVVKRQKIQEVVGGDKFVINNLLDYKYEPHEPDVIVSEACKLVGQELPYSIFSSNCEHFVTELRYGKPESRQVKKAAMIGRAAVGACVIVAVIVTRGAAVGAAVGIGMLAVVAVLLYKLKKKPKKE